MAKKRAEERADAVEEPEGVESGSAMEAPATEEPPHQEQTGGPDQVGHEGNAGGEPAGVEEAAPDQGQAGPAVEALRQELAQAQQRYEQAEATRQQVWERYLRLQADFDNFRRRVERERAEWQEQAVEHLVREILPVLDNLERALSATPGGGAAGEAAASALATGVKMVYDQLRMLLEQAGLEPVDAVGQPFDPRVHEAVDRVEAPGHEPDRVVEELQRGYLFRSKLIRPSMVRVAQVPEGEGGNSIG